MFLFIDISLAEISYESRYQKNNKELKKEMSEMSVKLEQST